MSCSCTSMYTRVRNIVIYFSCTVICASDGAPRRNGTRNERNEEKVDMLCALDIYRDCHWAHEQCDGLCCLSSVPTIYALVDWCTLNFITSALLKLMHIQPIQTQLGQSTSRLWNTLLSLKNSLLGLQRFTCVHWGRHTFTTIHVF